MYHWKGTAQVHLISTFAIYISVEVLQAHFDILHGATFFNFSLKLLLPFRLQGVSLQISQADTELLRNKTFLRSILYVATSQSGVSYPQVSFRLAAAVLISELNNC